MCEITITYRFLSYWHISAGVGRGPDADLTVVKDAAGLPIIPGRTAKGLWRDACRELLRRDGQSTESLKNVFTSAFGPEFATTADENSRYQGDRGSWHFPTAELPDEVRRHLDPKYIPSLYRTIASTALDETGLAKAHTLRTIEVVIPLELTSKMRCPDENSKALLSRATVFFRSLGLKRRRGFGRVEVSVS